MQAERMYTQEELDALALGAGERMRAAIAGGSAQEALATYDAVEGTWRIFCLNIEAWGATLTRNWLVEAEGLDQPPAPLRVEGPAILALRRGAAVEQLALIGEMLDGPEHGLRGRLAKALGDGDRAAAEAAWAEAEAAMALARALRVDHVNDILGFVHRRSGDEGLDAAMRYGAERGVWREALSRWATMEPRELLAESAFFLTAAAGCAISIVEHDDCFALHLHECHCGRQIRDARANGWDLPVVQGPSPLTYGAPAMTPYQVHYAAIHGTWSIDVIGKPVPVTDCVGTAFGNGQPCRAYVYKEGVEVPDRYYDVLGRSRASA